MPFMLHQLATFEITPICQRLSHHMPIAVSLAGAKITLADIDARRIICKGQFSNCWIGVAKEIDFVAKQFH